MEEANQQILSSAEGRQTVSPASARLSAEEGERGRALLRAEPVVEWRCAQ